MLVAVGLVVGSSILLRFRARGVPIVIPRWAWLLEILAGLVVITSFVWDFRVVLETGEPGAFHWPLYGAGMVLGILVFGHLVVGLGRRSASSAGESLG